MPEDVYVPSRGGLSYTRWLSKPLAVLIAIRILSARNGGPVYLPDIASAVGVGSSHLTKILPVLLDRKYVYRVEISGRYKYRYKYGLTEAGKKIADEAIADMKKLARDAEELGL